PVDFTRLIGVGTQVGELAAFSPLIVSLSNDTIALIVDHALFFVLLVVSLVIRLIVQADICPGKQFWHGVGVTCAPQENAPGRECCGALTVLVVDAQGN